VQFPLLMWGTASACAVLRLWCGARLLRVQFSACGVAHGFSRASLNNERVRPLLP